MESRVLEFLENWVAQNVRATGSATDKTVEVERLIELFKQHARTGSRAYRSGGIYAARLNPRRASQLDR